MDRLKPRLWDPVPVSGQVTHLHRDRRQVRSDVGSPATDDLRTTLSTSGPPLPTFTHPSPKEEGSPRNLSVLPSTLGTLPDV